MKKYFIISVNCDCASYLIARTNLPRSITGSIKCRSCGKKVGLMQWTKLGEAKGNGEFEAFRNWRKRRETNQETT